ncbi:MAG: VOC family protein, partial [Chloroflexi bacterium]|nr:VOC family protein [Chloroflexota bacterium]
GDATVVLGTGDAPLLILIEDRGAAPWTRGFTGLHHFAPVLPTRGDLGRLYRRLLDHGYEPIGEEHRASEAIYFDDPDDQRIEMYQDRPRDMWGSVAAHPFDAAGLLAAGEAESGRWEGLPPGTRLGHMHLRVGEIERAKDFYHGVLGFDVMAEMPEALFVSAGGYHHHIGMNIWESKGASVPPEHMAGLRFFTVDLPNAEALEAVVDRITAAGLSAEPTADGVTVRDPWGTRIVLRPDAARNSASAATLATSV